MKKNARKFFTALIVSLALFGCSGGGGAGDAVTQDTTSNDNIDTGSTNTNSSTPAISGFDFALQQGDFWEFGWDYSNSYTAAYNSSSSSYHSRFRITLGAPITNDGTTFYEMLISGNTKAGDSKDLTPRGKYLAVSGNRILTLDASGTTQKVIFDAAAGSWPGSGFFTVFPSTTLFQATPSTISNDYINQAAFRVSESASSSQCQYFSGVGTICGGDYNENMDEREYYLVGIGPAGFYSHFSMSDLSSPDGGWSSSNTTNIGLTASSLRGDSVDYTLEIEPNNQTTQATPITLPAKVKGDGVSETVFGGTTAVPLSAVSVSETEPNDSPFAPQTADIPSTINGNILEGDPNTSVTVQSAPSGGTTYTTTFEDWYEVTLGTAGTLNVALDFPGTGADLDMYLFSLDNSNAVITYTNSINDNIGTGTFSEQMSKSLSAGTYYVAIDAYNTSGGRADYSLGISTGSSTVNIADWFSFSLSSPSQVSVTVTGGPSFVLRDGTGTSTLASGGAAGTTVSLSAGTYLIGVSDGAAYTLDVASL
jgi:hypothetical protein